MPLLGPCTQFYGNGPGRVATGRTGPSGAAAVDPQLLSSSPQFTCLLPSGGTFAEIRGAKGARRHTRAPRERRHARREAQTIIGSSRLLWRHSILHHFCRLPFYFTLFRGKTFFPCFAMSTDTRLYAGIIFYPRARRVQTQCCQISRFRNF